MPGFHLYLLRFWTESKEIQYIFIYCYPQKDFFIVTQLFSEARHVGRLKLGSKPAQLYVRLSIRLVGQQAYHASLGNYEVLHNTQDTSS